MSLRATVGGIVQVGLKTRWVIGGEDRRRPLGRSDDDRHSQGDFALVERPQRVAGDVHHDVALAQVVRHPPPALHVRDDLADPLGGGNIERVPGGFPHHAVLPKTVVGLEPLDRSLERSVIDGRRKVLGGIFAGRRQARRNAGTLASCMPGFSTGRPPPPASHLPRRSPCSAGERRGVPHTGRGRGEAGEESGEIRRIPRPRRDFDRIELRRDSRQFRSDQARRQASAAQIGRIFHHRVGDQQVKFRLHHQA